MSSFWKLCSCLLLKKPALHTKKLHHWVLPDHMGLPASAAASLPPLPPAPSVSIPRTLPAARPLHWQLWPPSLLLLHWASLGLSALCPVCLAQRLAHSGYVVNVHGSLLLCGSLLSLWCENSWGAVLCPSHPSKSRILFFIFIIFIFYFSYLKLYLSKIKLF